MIFLESLQNKFKMFSDLFLTEIKQVYKYLFQKLVQSFTKTLILNKIVQHIIRLFFFPDLLKMKCAEQNIYKYDGKIFFKDFSCR